MVEANGGTQPLFDIGEFVSGTTPLFADLPSVPLQLSPVSPVASTAAASTVGSSLPATAPPATLAGTSPPISQQTPVQTVATSAEPNPTLSALPPTASPVLCGDVDMVDSAQTPHAKPTLFASGVGTAGPADPAGAVGVGVGVGSDTTSSSATEAAAAAAAAVPLDSTILDFSPDWDWETGGAKILVTGVFGGGDLTVPIWCMFGDLEVPCVRVLPNVLRCYAPPHAPGVVCSCTCVCLYLHVRLFPCVCLRALLCGLGGWVIECMCLHWCSVNGTFTSQQHSYTSSTQTRARTHTRTHTRAHTPTHAHTRKPRSDW